jgi:hypothetical protein
MLSNSNHDFTMHFTNAFNLCTIFFSRLFVLCCLLARFFFSLT